MNSGISSAVACLIFSIWIANAAAHRSAIQICFYFYFSASFHPFAFFLPTSFVEPGIFMFVSFCCWVGALTTTLTQLSVVTSCHCSTCVQQCWCFVVEVPQFPLSNVLDHYFDLRSTKKKIIPLCEVWNVVQRACQLQVKSARGWAKKTTCEFQVLCAHAVFVFCFVS